MTYYVNMRTRSAYALTQTFRVWVHMDRLVPRRIGSKCETWREDQDQPAMERAGKIESIIEDAKSFCFFLLEGSRKIQEQQQTERVHVTHPYQDDFSATFFPANSVTPLHQFAGQDPGTSVVLTATELGEKDSSPLNTPSFCEDPPTHSPNKESEDSVVKNDVKGTFCTEINKLVTFGQQLTNKRVFLSHSALLHTKPPTHTHSTDELVCSVGDKPLTPISLDRARYLCSLYALGARQLSRQLPTLWVVIDDNRPQGVVAMGTSYTDGVLHTYTISVEDPLGSRDQSPDSGRRRHSIGLGKAEKWAYSEYEISNASPELKSSGYSELTLMFAWPEPEAILAPPPENADAVLKISCRPGGLFSPVLPVYQELKTLLFLCDVSLGRQTWPEENDNSEDIPNTTVASRVGTFLQEATQPTFQQLDATILSPTADHTVYEPRTDLDFAERLWMFAKDVRSFEELHNVFAAVFKAVLFNQVQPFLHRSSASVLSTTFRQGLLMTQQEERQTLAAQLQSLLSETKLTACLVETGIEKLQRDYSSFFVGADLLTGLQLDAYFSTATTPLDQCQCLIKLHHVLELLSAAMSFLTIPTTTLSSLAKVALEVYRSLPVEDSVVVPVFQLPLPAYSQPLKSIVALCSNLTPSQWTLSTVQSKGMELSGSLKVLRNHPLFQNSVDRDTASEHMYSYIGSTSVVSIVNSS